MRKKLPLYLLIAFIVANLVYIVVAPLMIKAKIERDTAAVSKSRGTK